MKTSPHSQPQKHNCTPPPPMLTHTHKKRVKRHIFHQDSEATEYHCTPLPSHTSLGIFSFLTALLRYLGSVKAAGLLHAGLLINIIASPMSFFDTTPLGRIMNRFSKDIDTVDMVIPLVTGMFLMCLFQTVSTLLVISLSTPMFLVVIFPLLFFYYFVQVLLLTETFEKKKDRLLKSFVVVFLCFYFLFFFFVLNLIDVKFSKLCFCYCIDTPFTDLNCDFNFFIAHQLKLALVLSKV